MKYKYEYETIIGKITIIEDEKGICEIGIKDAGKRGDYIEKETELIRKTYNQLQEYFKGERKEFDIPLSINGTIFQEKVWKALTQIPYGETRSYKDIAIKAGNEKASRAVGMANNKNKIMIVIPCHRVIGTNKKLVGYAGGLDVKEKLLEIEKHNI